MIGECQQEQMLSSTTGKASLLFSKVNGRERHIGQGRRKVTMLSRQGTI